MEFVDKTMNAIDKQQVPLAILMDFSKAFDTLDHKILLDKLKYYGIQGITLLVGLNMFNIMELTLT